MQQKPKKLWLSYTKIYDAVKIDSQILLDDGAVELRVEQILPDEIICRIMNTGILGNKKGVNMPGIPVDLPAMCEKDKEDIRY